MSYEPLHHKYRPQKFVELVGQEAIAQTLTNALESDRIAPAYLFTGPRGTGKTSSARILSKSLNCLQSDRPTPSPCGKCEVCRQIARGSAMDVIEIDAASNTGVDNIREIIERAQFAPVQCRYKVYVIDECLTGDSLVQTRAGLMRIDDPNLKGKMVLSYNEVAGVWEYKKVRRWLKRGVKEILVIKTGDRELRCTENHLIRTEKGWIEAKNVKEGMKILSPVNVDAEYLSINMGSTGESADLYQDTSLREINTDKNLTILSKFLNKQNQDSLLVNADVTKTLIFQNFSKKKERGFRVFYLTGKDIHIKKVTESGKAAVKTLLPLPNNCDRSNWDLSMEHYLEMEASNTQIHTVDFQDCVGHMEKNKENGWNTKQINYQSCVQNYKMSLIEDMAKNQLFAKQLVILNCEKFIKLLSQMVQENWFLGNGFKKLLQKDLRGGIWMMVLSNLALKEALQFNFTLRDFLKMKIKLLPTGLQIWDIPLVQIFTLENQQERHIGTLKWEQNLVENGCQSYNNTQSPQWITNLEKVESVHRDGYEKVYDLEVEDNHNFVANGLLVHNCHMLSTPAFNALLKTLEEPPNRVIFVLATTDPQRVLNTIISRCQRFDFRRIPLESMVKHLTYIAVKEEIDIAGDAVTLVAQIANGGLRDAESLLDQLSLIPDQVTVEKVWDLVGAVPERDLLVLLKAIHSDDPEAVIEQCRHLMDRGREPLIVLQNLATFYLNLLIAKTSPQRSDLVAVTTPTWQELCQEAKQWDIAVILQGQQKLKESEVQIKNTTQPRLWLEVTLLGLLPSAIAASLPTNTAPESSRQSTSNQTKIAPRQSTQAPPTAPSKPAISQPQPTTEKSPFSTVQEPSQTVSNSAPRQALSNEERFQKRVEESWQKVLQTIEPPASRALVKQSCVLIDFDIDESIAYLGMNKPNLFKLAQTKIPQIEEAFEQVWQQKIKVKLQVEKKNKSSKIESNSRTIAKPNSEVRSNLSSQNSAVKEKAIANSQSTSIKKSPISPVREKIDAKKNGDRIPTAKIDSPPESAIVEPKEEEESETLLAANEFASIFEGEVLDLEVDFFKNLSESEHNSQPPTIQPPPQPEKNTPPPENPNVMPF